MQKDYCIPYIWDFSEEEITDLENPESWASVHIADSPVPAIFEEDGNWYLYAFTSIDAIPEDFQQQYAIAKHPADYIYALMCAIEKALGKEIMLAVYSLGGKSEEILTKEQAKTLF